MNCAYCGTELRNEDDPGYKAAPGVILCDICWDNHDPKHPFPISWKAETSAKVEGSD